jgi:hypothetical protein
MTVSFWLIIICIFILAVLILIGAINAIMLMKRLKVKNRVLIITAVLGVVIILSAFPAYVMISYNNANSTKTIQMQAITTLESKLKQEYSVSSLKVTVSRGGSCSITVNGKDSTLSNNQAAIKGEVEDSLNNGLTDKIKSYVNQHYNSSYQISDKGFSLILSYPARIVQDLDVN